MRKTLTLTFLFLIQVLGVPLFATVTIQGTGGDTLKGTSINIFLTEIPIVSV